jgi:hypothetical protein
MGAKRNLKPIAESPITDYVEKEKERAVTCITSRSEVAAKLGSSVSQFPVAYTRNNRLKK